MGGLIGIGQHPTSNPTSHTQTGGGPTTSPPPTSGTTTGKKTKPPAVSWKTVPLTIFNGYSATVPAAGTAETQLKALGGTVVNITNTSPQTTTATYVAYPVGKLAAAKAVAKRFHLGKPVPLQQAAGVPTDLATVAIVLGPNGIPPRQAPEPGLANGRRDADRVVIDVPARTVAKAVAIVLVMLGAVRLFEGRPRSSPGWRIAALPGHRAGAGGARAAALDVATAGGDSGVPGPARDRGGLPGGADRAAGDAGGRSAAGRPRLHRQAQAQRHPSRS